MRTKTLALSALLGMLGTASLVAQTNVYSLNAVGYINITIPASSWNILTCPFICSPDNTLNTVLPNTNGQYKKAKVYQMAGGTYTVTEVGVATSVQATGWQFGGADVTMNPGQAVWFYNSTASPMSATFVGQVPQTNIYNMTNTMTPGWNLIGSIIPASGDISSNACSALTNLTKKDFVYTYDPTNGGYSGKDIVAAPGNGSGYNKQWGLGDPIIDQVGYGFFFYNNQSTNEYWVQNFSINP